MFQRPETWARWLVFLKALFALPMTADELEIYRYHTQRERPPSTPASEALALCGRRSGKTRIAAFIACFVAVFLDLRRYLSPGEQARILIICPDRRQARVAFGYCKAFLRGIAVFSELIERETNDVIELTNGVSIEIATCSSVSTRGYAVPLVVADEAAFWYSDTSSTPDKDILDAVRFAMAQFPQALLLMISSPWAKRGETYRVFRENFGKDDADALVWRGKSDEMNGTLPASFRQRQESRDSVVASVELDAEFHPDISTAFDRERMEALIDTGVCERAPVLAHGSHRIWTYKGFVDPAGGGGPDSYCAGVAHQDGKDGVVVLDAALEIRAPFNTEAASEQVADFFKRYGVTYVHGDHYAGEWPAQALRKNGISYEVSERTKSEIYLECIGHVITGRVRLLDNRRLLTQLTLLERRALPSGRVSVDHPRNGSDDLANAACGAILSAADIFRSVGDTGVIAGRSTMLDAFDRNVAPERYTSMFDRYEEAARSPLSDPALWSS
jgi:hypothetical protein